MLHRVRPKEVVSDIVSLSWALDPCLWVEQALGVTVDKWQQQLLLSASQTTLLLAGRQVGKTTATSWLGLHTALYLPGSLIVVVAPSQRQSIELGRKIRCCYDLMPPGSAPALVEDNKMSIEMANGSRVVAISADPDTARGYSGPRMVIVDEAAFCEQSLFTAVLPMLAASGGKLILLSSANGREGQFYEFWTSDDSSIARITVKSADCKRIKSEYLAQMRRMMSDSDYRREFECEFTMAAGRLFTDDDFLNVIDSSISPIRVDDNGEATAMPLNDIENEPVSAKKVQGMGSVCGEPSAQDMRAAFARMRMSVRG